MISVDFLENLRKIPSAQPRKRQGEMPLNDIRDRTHFQFYFLFPIPASLPAISGHFFLGAQVVVSQIGDRLHRSPPCGRSGTALQRSIGGRFG